MGEVRLDCKGGGGMEDNKKIGEARFKFPKNKQDYMIKILGYTILGLIILFVANKISTNFAIIILLIVLIVLSEKIYMFFSVDEVVLKNGNFLALYKEKIKNKIPINNLGVKITHDINGVKEISFYDFFRSKKIIYFKENEVEKDSLFDFIHSLEKYCDVKELFDNGTYGEVVQLSCDLPIGVHNIDYVTKKSFYSSYGWTIIPMIIVIVVLTLLFNK